jgi:hypothetical protein
VYKATNGFPCLVDIYGEESAGSIEVIAKGFDILYTNRIVVNHRVNMELRIKAGEQIILDLVKQPKMRHYYLVY